MKSNEFLKLILDNADLTCPECGRKFDMFDEEQSEEWHNGHDCEVEA